MNLIKYKTIAEFGWRYHLYEIRQNLKTKRYYAVLWYGDGQTENIDDERATLGQCIQDVLRFINSERKE